MDNRSKMTEVRSKTKDISLYTEDILDLYKYPSNKKITEHADITYHDENPSCGDDITIYITLENSTTIQHITWTGKGCAISQASAEIISQIYKGKKIKEIQNITPEQIKKQLNIKDIGPVRIKCAMLAPAAIKKGVENWKIYRGGTRTREARS